MLPITNHVTTLYVFIDGVSAMHESRIKCCIPNNIPCTLTSFYTDLAYPITINVLEL